jgi:hypothetical protein
MVRNLALPVVLAALLVGPTMSQAATPTANAAPVQLAAGSDFSSEKDSYVAKAKSELQEWRDKLDRFGDKAGAKSQQVGDTAKADLQAAWAKTEEEGRRLQSASADGWDKAKSAFEEATQHLKDTWHRIHPEDE